MTARMRVLPPALLLALAACQPPPQPESDPRPIASAGTPTTPLSAVRREGNFKTEPLEIHALKPAPMTTQKLETVDVHVDMSREGDLRKVVPFLLKSDEWMLVKCEHTGPTKRHYQFARIITAAGPLPLPDPLFNPPK